MKISARNQLKGTVAQITPGAVNAEVIFDLGGGQQLVAIVTNESVKTLGLAEGKSAYALIKASSILVGVD
jgi:molybdate transport system regulatory protein